MTFTKGAPTPGRPANPFTKGTAYAFYYDVFTRVTAPSDSDVVKETWRLLRRKTTISALQSFKHRLRAGTFPGLLGKPIETLALQPRSDWKELEQWWKLALQARAPKKKK